MISKTIKGHKLSIFLVQHLELDCPDIEDDYEALFSVFAVEYGDMGYDVETLPWYKDIIEYLDT